MKHYLLQTKGLKYCPNDKSTYFAYDSHFSLHSVISDLFEKAKILFYNMYYFHMFTKIL